MKNNYNRGFVEVVAFIVIAGLVILFFVWIFSGDNNVGTKKTAIQESNAINEQIAENVPIPKITTSSERANVSKRAELFNIKDKISYI